MAGPSSSSRSSSSSSATLGRMPGPPHHLQGKRLDSTPVMALNNNLGLPRLCNSLCPLARRHPQGAPRPATLPPRSLAVTISTRFFSLPSSAASAPPSQALPLLLVGTVHLSFQPLFFFSRKNVFPCIRRSLRPPRCFLLGHDVDCPFFLSLHNYLTFPFFGYCFVTNHSIWPARSERLHRLIIPTSSCQLSALYLGNVYVPIPNTPTSHLPTRPL